MQRDVKGMNQRARAGGIKEFTGISFPCENPENPGLARYTDKLSIEECAKWVIRLLKQKGLVTSHANSLQQ